jgi:phosphoserine phosphatase RsbU/P
MALAKLSGGDGTVTVARAGHNPPLLVRSDGRAEWISPPGVALGLASSRIFEEACGVHQLNLGAGDTLLLYTDGLTEAMNEVAEEYGEDRLVSATRAARQLDATSMRDAILRDVADFRGGAEVNDDLTLVVIKGNKRSEGA